MKAHLALCKESELTIFVQNVSLSQLIITAVRGHTTACCSRHRAAAIAADWPFVSMETQLIEMASGLLTQCLRCIIKSLLLFIFVFRSEFVTESLSRAAVVGLAGGRVEGHLGRRAHHRVVKLDAPAEGI